MIEAELPDGTILDFPEGTSPDVVQRTVKNYLSQSQKPQGNLLNRNPFASAVVKGIAGTAGLPATLANAPADIARFGIRAFGGEVTPQMQATRVPFEYSDILPLVEKVTGPLAEPKGTAQKLVSAGIEFGTSPAKSGIGVLGNIASGIGSEAAGMATEGSVLEAPARILGALAGGKASSAATGSPFAGAAKNRAEQTLERAAGDTTLQEVQSAINTANRAKSLGVPLTTAEATGSPSLMATTGSVSRDTNTTKFVDDFIEKRQAYLPEAEKSLIKNTIADIDVEDADIAGRALIKEANAYTESLKKLRSEAAKPLYQQAFFKGNEPVRLPSENFSGLLKDKNVLLRINDVRNSDPNLSQLPINSVAVLDKVKSEFLKDSKKGLDPNQQRIMGNYARQIQQAIDSTLGDSPRGKAYKEARKIWAEDSEEISRAIDTEIGALQSIRPLKEAEAGAKLLNLTSKQVKSISDKLPAGAVRNAASATMQKIVNEKSGKKSQNIRELFFKNIEDQKKIGVLVKDEEALAAWEDFSDALRRIQKQSAVLGGSNTINKAANDLDTQRAITGAAADLTRGGTFFTVALNLVQRVSGSGNFKPLSPQETKNLATLLINSEEGLKTLERLKSNPARRDLQKIQAFVDAYRASLMTGENE